MSKKTVLLVAKGATSMSSNYNSTNPDTLTEVVRDTIKALAPTPNEAAFTAVAQMATSAMETAQRNVEATKLQSKTPDAAFTAVSQIATTAMQNSNMEVQQERQASARTISQILRNHEIAYILVILEFAKG